MRGCAGLVEVCVPHAGWGHEGAAGFPVDSDRVDDLATIIEARADQGVAAGIGVKGPVTRATD